MIRFLPGLALACLITGCGESDAPVQSSSAPPPAETLADASAETAETEGTEEPGAQGEEAILTTVSLKVPGMH